MRLVAVDPGLTGALVVLDDGELIEAITMPVTDYEGKNFYDHQAIRTWLIDHRPDRAVIEQQQPYPATADWCRKCRLKLKPCGGCKGLACPECKEPAQVVQGIVSTGRTMHGYGLLCGIMIGLDIKYHRVTAQSWTKIYKAMRVPGQGKERGVNLCQKLWPSFDLRATSRSKKPHTGISDAAIIGYTEWLKISQHGEKRREASRLDDELLF